MTPLLRAFQETDHFHHLALPINQQKLIYYQCIPYIPAKIGEQYPWLVEHGVLEVLLPKKADLTVIKLYVSSRYIILPTSRYGILPLTHHPTFLSHYVFIHACRPEHVQILILDHTPLFFSTRDGGWFPTLRILHQYPDMMPKLRTDKGAIKFVLSGANIMCPGLTSPGATIHDEVDEGSAVAIFAEDKEHPMAIGYTTMSTEEMKNVNKGIGVENLHYLNDGLWKTVKLA